MTREEHRQKAVDLLKEAEELKDRIEKTEQASGANVYFVGTHTVKALRSRRSQTLAEAQVHATLALTAPADMSRFPKASYDAETKKN